MGQAGSYIETQDCQFLQVNGTFYVESKLRSYKKRVPHAILFCEYDNTPKPFEVKNDNPRTVYGEIITEKGRDGIIHWARTCTPWLTEEPKGAQSVNSEYFRHQGPDMTLYTDSSLHSKTVIEPEPAHSTIHALYAYPLSALSLIAVDIPTTLVTNSLFLGGGLISMPYFWLTNEYQEQETQE